MFQSASSEWSRCTLVIRKLQRLLLQSFVYLDVVVELRIFSLFIRVLLLADAKFTFFDFKQSQFFTSYSFEYQSTLIFAKKNSLDNIDVRIIEVWLYLLRLCSSNYADWANGVWNALVMMHVIMKHAQICVLKWNQFSVHWSFIS